MKEIKKLLRLSKIEYYETHLSIINCILPKKMTPMEIRVMASFMSLEGHIIEYRFGPSGKKIVMSQLEITASGLSNYLGSLTDKGFITKDEGIVQILPLLMPENKEQLYLFKLENIG